MKRRVIAASSVIVVLALIIVLFNTFTVDSSLKYNGILKLDEFDDNIINYTYNNEVVCHNSEFLGAQYNNSDRSKARFVSVVHSDILRLCDDYGFMFYTVDKKSVDEDIKNITTELTDIKADNKYKKYSCKNSVNNVFSGNYGNNDYNFLSPGYSRYKYISVSMSGIKDDKYLIAKFYTLLNGNYHFAISNSNLRGCVYSTSNVINDVRDKIQLAGHRGAMDIAPENTLVSFEKAAERGYPEVETDFWVTNSGDILCLHNENLEKCGRRDLNIRDLNTQSRFNFPIINDKNAPFYKPQYIPTIEEVVKKVSELKLKLFLHVKDRDTSDEKIEEVKNILLKYNMFDKTTFVSSSPFCVQNLARHNCITCYLVVFPSDTSIENAFNLCDEYNLSGIMVKYISGFPKAENIEKAHEKNLRFGAYNANNISKLMWLVDNNCDYIMLNNWM